MRLAFWYNHTFGKDPAGGAQRSWTRLMRPDYSLRIQPEGDYLQDGVWLHFDAKYRVEGITELFGEVDAAADPDADAAEADPTAPAASRQRGRRDDLLKMHAYRDAIVESAGAYVLYPGPTPEPFREHGEILPGLGAFPLRPTEGGEGTGAQAVGEFLRDVLAHVASQVTQHERSRWWVREAHREQAATV